MLLIYARSGPAAGLVLMARAEHDNTPLTQEEVEHCQGEPVQLDRLGLRIGAIFVILATSLLGAVVPVLLGRQRKTRMPSLVLFVCKYLGTGVIVATAWLHLLAPALEQLQDRCVTSTWPSMGGYTWALCIALMTVMVMFLVELIVTGQSKDSRVTSSGAGAGNTDSSEEMLALEKSSQISNSSMPRLQQSSGHDDVEAAPRAAALGPASGNGYGIAGQLTALLILEFGVIFHSVFIGLTLGTVGADELVVLFIVLVFHQLFEGLGLGSRLAVMPWPRGRSWVPHVMAIAFALSTPLGIAASIAAKPDNAATQKLVNGIFDSISAGILTYTGLVELLGHELMFNPEMRKSPLRTQLLAYACVASGVALMALLAKWA